MDSKSLIAETGLNFDKFTLGWIVGIIEGEGCLARNNTEDILITVHMTDKDVIAKLASLFNRPYYTRKRKFNERLKDVYTFSLFGCIAVNLLKLIKPYLGVRRQCRADELLLMWSNKQKRKEKEFKIRMKRNKKIIALYKSGKYTKKALAKKFNMATVAFILREAGL